VVGDAAQQFTNRLLRLGRTWSTGPALERTSAAEPRSTVTFDIEPAGDGVVKLTVVHDGFAPGSTIAEMVSGGWLNVIASLKTLPETGDPLPACPPARPERVILVRQAAATGRGDVEVRGPAPYLVRRGAPDDYTADSGRTLTLRGPEDGSRSADGMGGTREVG
jgi:hypothetical protein